jgi:hypothetical protein
MYLEDKWGKNNRPHNMAIYFTKFASVEARRIFDECGLTAEYEMQ